MSAELCRLFRSPPSCLQIEIVMKNIKDRCIRLKPSLLVVSFLAVSFFAVGIAPKLTTTASPADAPSQTEILWDTWGVPHIFAKDDRSLFYAFGYAQTQSHGDLILRLYGQARGRAAEYWGEQYLQSDQWVRMNSVYRRASEWYQAQSPQFRGFLNAFAEGVNNYARENKDKIANDVKVVLPVNAVDILAHTQRVIHFSFIANPQTISGAERQLEAQAGSNAWAIGPKHSASKKAMLLANPHLPWSDYFIFYESQLVLPDYNIYGAALVGFPGLGIAFNDNLGWSHTVNTHDGVDLFALTLTEGGYKFDGRTRAFDTEEEIIKVKQRDGSMRDEKLVVKRSVHGPVIAEKNGKAIAMRVVGLDQPRMLEQWWDMARATDFKEFETILKRLQIPMFTVMYADRKGHIMHFFGGDTPARAIGNYNWAGVAPGDVSTTLWTKYHSFEELPLVADPKSGWLQNANDPPWTTTFPLALEPNRFPSYMAPRAMSFRAQRSARMLDEDDSISFEEMIRYKHSTRMELADRILDDLILAARNSASEKAKRAAEVLAKWDRSADAGSRGAVLFQAFRTELIRQIGGAKMFALPWNETDPRNTPKGLADVSGAITALEKAVDQVESDYGAIDVAWGEVNRLRIAGVDLPANGGGGELGIFRVVNFAPEKDKKFRATGGDTYVAAIEFSDPIRAMALVSYGNSSQPGSKHQTDQLPLFSRKELRPVWRTIQELVGHLEERKVF